jgi:hypothetical protein
MVRMRSVESWRILLGNVKGREPEMVTRLAWFPEPVCAWFALVVWHGNLLNIFDPAPTTAFPVIPDIHPDLCQAA